MNKILNIFCGQLSSIWNKFLRGKILHLFFSEIEKKTYYFQKPGVMVPIPQYPLYSATLAEYGMEKVYITRQTNDKEVQPTSN